MTRMALVAVFAAALTGCSFYHLNQEDAFIDDDGLVLNVRYGELSRDYTYEMVSPMNGAVVECTASEVVDVQLPEPSEEVIRCYRCQNPGTKGTWYETRDHKWRYWTIGTHSRLYLINEAGDDYLLVFEGKFFMTGDDEKEPVR